MTIQEVGQGRRITYKKLLPTGQTDDTVVMTIETKLDGSEADVMLNGKPTGETISIRRVDDNRTTSVIKFEGKEVGTSKAELSANGRELKIENEYTVPFQGQQPGKTIGYWDRF
jgi:hypothetical protein